jgi:hypothetical protein
LVFGENRLKILWFFDSRIFGGRRKINELSDSYLIGPDSGGGGGVCGLRKNDSIAV